MEITEMHVASARLERGMWHSNLSKRSREPILGSRPKVGHETLDLGILVRFQAPQPVVGRPQPRGSCGATR